jgi:hypothetical protein
MAFSTRHNVNYAKPFISFFVHAKIEIEKMQIRRIEMKETCGNHWIH